MVKYLNDDRVINLIKCLKGVWVFMNMIFLNCDFFELFKKLYII